ncbi:MAG: ARMT1-like domain-containing protein [Nitrospiraceae bacterium]|nr:ARMT1-like domain-containing protein [Nitrospiraceae bacterium]
MEEETGRFIAGAGAYGVKTELECLPCFFGQVTRTLNYAGVNGDRGRGIARKAAAIIEEASLDEVPARTTTVIHRLLRNETGIDPYQSVKQAYNRIALDRLPELRTMAAGTPDRLEGAVRVAIAGNVIDFGIYESIDLDRSVEESFQLPLSDVVYHAFAQAVRSSRRILYLCDNAGEIVFDRVLLEILRDLGKDVTAVVKGSPVINDATLVDAYAAGLRECATVIDNGCDGIGTLLEACSERFFEDYRSADLIISKGQANFETLVQEKDERIFFLFKIKCPVVASFLKRTNGDIVLMGGKSANR